MSSIAAPVDLRFENRASERPRPDCLGRLLSPRSYERGVRRGGERGSSETASATQLVDILTMGGHGPVLRRCVSDSTSWRWTSESLRPLVCSLRHRH